MGASGFRCAQAAAGPHHFDAAGDQSSPARDFCGHWKKQSPNRGPRAPRSGDPFTSAGPKGQACRRRCAMVSRPGGGRKLVGFRGRCGSRKFPGEIRDSLTLRRRYGPMRVFLLEYRDRSLWEDAYMKVAIGIRKSRTIMVRFLPSRDGSYREYKPCERPENE